MTHKIVDKTNYKLVYQIRHLKVNTDRLANLVAKYQNEAREKAEAEHKKYLDALVGLLGHNDFRVSSYVCVADGIAAHVFSPAEPAGVGKRVCVFCGLDDFDD